MRLLNEIILIQVVDDGFGSKSNIKVTKNGMLQPDRKLRLASELKQYEKDYQEERSEFKTRPNKRDKGKTKTFGGTISILNQ